MIINGDNALLDIILKSVLLDCVFVCFAVGLQPYLYP